jgi:hypothetical protein
MTNRDRSQGLSLDEFLGHDTKGGSGGKFLRGWRKRTPPVVNTWLHTRARIMPLWQHNWPRIHTFEDRETGETRREVWGGSFNCLEGESVLRKQYVRDRESGEREVPPEVCPLCLLSETLRKMIAAGTISIAAAVFEFKVGDDDEHSRILTAGGIANMLDPEKLTEQQKRECKKAGIKFSEGWKENATAKCNYLFRVVDHDQPDAGVQIAIETTLLGDKVKGVIRDQIASLGDQDGNPLRKPYVIQWKHLPNEKEFGKKYHALPMPRLELTEEIRSLIVDEDPPNVDRLVAPGNVTSLRAALERYALIDLPWDTIFAASEKLAAESGSGDTSFDPDDIERQAIEAEARKTKVQVPTTPTATTKPAATPTLTPAANGGRRKKVEAEPEPKVDTIPCDDCGHPMLPTESTCPKCGAKYEVDATPAVAAPVSKAKTTAKAAPVDDDPITW